MNNRPVDESSHLTYGNCLSMSRFKENGPYSPSRHLGSNPETTASIQNQDGRHVNKAHKEKHREILQEPNGFNNRDAK